MEKLKTRLAQAWDENPLAVITVAALAATAAAKVANAMTEANNSRTWKKEVDRRDRSDRRR